ncbi:MAG: hypothetical protein U1E39_07095 [Planctomycetota bacterium]
MKVEVTAQWVCVFAAIAFFSIAVIAAFSIVTGIGGVPMIPPAWAFAAAVFLVYLGGLLVFISPTIPKLVSAPLDDRIRVLETWQRSTFTMPFRLFLRVLLHFYRRPPAA